MEVGKDNERAFMIVEIAGDNLYFQTISAWERPSIQDSSATATAIGGYQICAT
jgi:hypothetical protein